MTQWEIVGPQERFERSGAQRLRDIRPMTTRLVGDDERILGRRPIARSNNSGSFVLLKSRGECGRSGRGVW